MSTSEVVKSWVGLVELHSVSLWKAATAEFIGSALLVFIGCATCLGADHWETAATPTSVQISLSFGLTVATLVLCISHVSGGHINPAVTVSLCVTRHMCVTRAVVYIIVQSLGAVCGAAILAGVTMETTWGNLGMTTIDKTLSVSQGFVVEVLITFTLVLTVFACCDKKRRDLNGSAALAIGLSVTACHLFAIKYTGSSMNPARSFGPAVVMAMHQQSTTSICPTAVTTADFTTTVNDITTECTHANSTWQHHWVYWIGPMFGGLLAGFLYEFWFAANSSLSRDLSLVTCRPVDDVTITEKEPELTKVCYTNEQGLEQVVLQ